jgi:leader peptidase (prepilin peptidase)/N-methyltransferase
LRISGVGLAYPSVGPRGIGIAALWMFALTVYDIRQRRLPNWLTVPGFAVVMLVAISSGRGDGAALGAGALAAVYLLAHAASPAAMGAGDVKLALGLGALTGCFGLEVWSLAAIGAPLLTAAIGVLARLGRAATSVPHGPSMCLASAGAVVLALL